MNDELLKEKLESLEKKHEEVMDKKTAYNIIIPLINEEDRRDGKRNVVNRSNE